MATERTVMATEKTSIATDEPRIATDEPRIATDKPRIASVIRHRLVGGLLSSQDVLVVLDESQVR